GHVWKTTDAGQTWTNVSTTASGLPDVSAYDLVVDPTSTFAAPNGKIFAAIDSGIYVSTDDGLHWQPYGQGLPSAPVVDLQLDSNQGVLAAATQGRSAFTIQVDDVGPHVTGISNNLTEAAVTVTFNEAIDTDPTHAYSLVTSHLASQVTIRDPN